MKITQKKHEVTADQAGRIDRVVQALTALPRRQIQGLFDHGCITLNGEGCAETFTRVAAGDVVGVDYEPQRGYRPKPGPWKSSMFRLVYEDEHLLVVDKAAWVLTEPTGAHPGGTLVAAVGEYLARGGRREKAFLVHRLDRGVSGLLVMGKSKELAEQLKEQFAAHKPQREYLGIVAGAMTTTSGTYRSHLATGENLDRYSTQDTKHGELAITHYRVVRVLADTTLVSVRLETGRRNQIRVHFAEVGHPVLGDPRYKSRLARHPRWPVKRLALHAAKLGFDHPVTAKAMLFESPLPTPMKVFLNSEKRI